MNKILDDAYNMLSWYRDKYHQCLSKTDEMQRRIDKLEEERKMLTEQVEALLQVIEATNEK